MSISRTLTRRKHPDDAHPHLHTSTVNKPSCQRELQDEGHQIVLWSIREGIYLEKAVRWCHERGLDFYAVNSEFPDASWSGQGVARKIKADVYIDDRNLGGIPDWSEIYSLISTSEGLKSDKPSDRKHHHRHGRGGKSFRKTLFHSFTKFFDAVREKCVSARERVFFNR